MRTSTVQREFLIPLLIALGACTPGPDYVRPIQELPAAFKEAGNWKPAAGADFVVTERWWQVLADPVLDALEEKVSLGNQNVKLAEAQYRAARATVDNLRSGYLPSVSAGAARTRSDNAAGVGNGTSYTATASLAWEVDVWGRIGRSVEGGEAKLQASAADLAAARLSSQALLAQTYCQLRATDLQLALLARTSAAYGRFLELTKNRLQAGVASPLDLAQAQTQVASAQAQEIDLANQRAQTEHALAVLVGLPPSGLDLPAASALPAQPPTPSLLPSTLLENRPDIIAAERRVASANAQIGVASAAWFPVLDLTGSLGYRNTSLAKLFDLPNRFWSLGPSLAMTVIDGGARSAAVEQAQAGYEQTVATYRQTVLTAMQEIEDNLAANRLLEQEAAAQGRALEAAKRGREIAEHQYAAGTVSALTVVSAQTTELSAGIAAIGIGNRRLQAALQLYKNTAGRVAP